jgi:transketolase
MNDKKHTVRTTQKMRDKGGENTMVQDPMSVDELKQMAATIRCDIIDMICTAEAGHPGGSLSATDIVTALYFRLMRIDPANPRWPDRDRFILSKGHACPVWYAALAERGFFDKSHLGTLRRLGSILQGHPDMNKVPGIDMTAGSLGQGLSVGIGMALAGKLQKKDYHVWVVIGDGESQEGSVWEAAMAGAKWKLGNLTAILDRNNLQNDWYVDDLMPIEPVADKWRAFGWHVVEINGHAMEEIVPALEAAKDREDGPTLILAHTIKGKGVSFMENVCEWHGKAPCKEEADQALKEIRRCSCEQ